MWKQEEFMTNHGEQEKIYSVTRWRKVEEEGPSNLFYDADNVDGRAGSFVSESGKYWKFQQLWNKLTQADLMKVILSA